MTDSIVPQSDVADNATSVLQTNDVDATPTERLLAAAWAVIAAGKAQVAARPLAPLSAAPLSSILSDAIDNLETVAATMVPVDEPVSIIRPALALMNALVDQIDGREDWFGYHADVAIALRALEAAFERRRRQQAGAALLSPEDTLRLRGLVCLAKDHMRLVEQLESAACLLTGEEVSGHTSDTIYGNVTVDELLERLGERPGPGVVI